MRLREFQSKVCVCVCEREREREREYVYEAEPHRRTKCPSWLLNLQHEPKKRKTISLRKGLVDSNPV